MFPEFTRVIAIESIKAFTNERFYAMMENVIHKRPAGLFHDPLAGPGAREGLCGLSR